jgi:hypothetical protein
MKVVLRRLPFLVLMVSVAAFTAAQACTVPSSVPAQSPHTLALLDSSDLVRSKSIHTQNTDGQGPYVSEPVTPGVSPRAGSLPIAPPWKSGDPVREAPRRTRDRQAAAAATETPPTEVLIAPDTASASFLKTPLPTLNFDGINFTGVIPPDTVGEVGPNHYIQMVNDPGGTRFTIYNKNGIPVSGPSILDALWTAGGTCASGSGDPIVLYDSLADRWLLSEFASAGNRLCVYISQTPDPTGAYFLYGFPTPQFPDYPKYAVWPDAYYVATNESSPAVYALDRVKMLNGQPATSQRFTAPDLAAFPFQALLPSDLDGPTPPPAGSPNYFMRHRDDEANNPGANNPILDFLEIWQFHVDFTTPANSTFTGPTNIAVSEFDSHVCGFSSFFCFPQPGTATTLDPIREVLMWRLQYRNFGAHETLVGNMVVDVGGTDHGGIRWFELRKTGASWTLFQEGTHVPDIHHRWMGSIATDQAGNIALGYSVSSSTLFPSIRYATRAASDPPGTLQAEVTLMPGGGSQTGSTRWGDYSSMNVDPVDDCTFWYTNEYYAATASVNWRTRIGTFKMPDCGPVGGLSVTPTTGLTSSGPQGGPFSPSSLVYMLTNTGGAPIDWTLSKTQNWTDPTSGAGFLAAGASTTVTVSINANANLLAPGNYVDTFTFTNTTNGVGNTTRSVNLTVSATTTPLTVTINQAVGQADPTNISRINFSVVFSASVSNFATGDVTLAGTAGATTGRVTGSGTTYNVAVSGMTANGTVIATIPAGVATDAAGNGNTASTSTDNTVTFATTPDTTPPTVAINQAVGQADPTNTSPINFAVVFSESVSNFATGDVTLEGTAGATTGTVTGSGTTYNVAVSGMTSNGTVMASIAVGVATDAAGNGNTASTSADNTVTFDTTPPTVTINQAMGQADPTNTSPINFSVVFSESVSNFATGDVTLAGTAGATTGMVIGSGTTYNVAVSGMTSSGTVIAFIAVGMATDAAGNGNTASTSADNTVTFDATTPLTVTINQAVGQADPTNISRINFSVVFSASVSNFATGDVTLAGTAGATTGRVTGSGTTYNVTVSGMTLNGTVIATIAAGVATDAAGNSNTASTSADNTVTFNATP